MENDDVFMANDLELAAVCSEGRAGALTEEAHMAMMHAKALAAYVEAEQAGQAVFPTQVDGGEYEVIVRRKDRHGDLFE